MNATSAETTFPGQGNSGGRRRLEPDSLVVDRIPVQATADRPSPGAPWIGGNEGRLAPRQPPGRITRKSRAYASEILRLRGAGYSLDAIREALAEVGVKVSISTVWRETTRSTNEPAVPVIGTPRSQAKARCLVGCKPSTTHRP